MIKRAGQCISLAVALPFALVSGFGRVPTLFQCMAHLMALLPGLPGDYLRTAYYTLTLEECSINSRVSFGSFFAHRSAKVSAGVYIGAYCVLGKCEIGERTQIASSVQILSGRRQHLRLNDGQLQGANEGQFRRVSIGSDCWIGTLAVVMADVGSGSTVGAGAVVVRPIPSGVVAVGNPARILDSEPRSEKDLGNEVRASS